MIGLHTVQDTAERIKLKYGCAIIDDADPNLLFKVTRMGSNIEKEFSQADLANIIEPRVQEIFHLIRGEVNRLGFSQVNGGYVLAGGTVNLPGTLAVAQAELNNAVRIGVPDFIASAILPLQAE